MTPHRSARGVRRPSPALVVSILALVVACTGTAVAAGVLIKSSSQVGKNVITSNAIKNGSIQHADIKPSAITRNLIKNGAIDASKLSKSALTTVNSDKPASFEAFHRDGPTVAGGANQNVVTLSNLAPGPYAIFAKTVAGRLQPPKLFQPANASLTCQLAGGGEIDYASGPLSSTGSSNQVDLHLQFTHNFGSTADVVLSCSADADWHAGASSIIAIALANATRTAVDG